jgi:hypothetical protein
MKEIIELNNRIRREARHAMPKGDGFILVMRFDADDGALVKLPAGIRGQLETLRMQLARAIPNDFDYTLILGEDDPALMLIFRDGGMTEGSCPETWDNNRSIFRQLSEVDWDKHRQHMMAQGHIFDQIGQIAKEASFKLTLAEETQKRFAREVERFLRTNQKDKSRIHVLLWRGDEGISEEALNNEEAFKGFLIDVLATNYSVIAALIDGKPVAPQKLDDYIREALLEMKATMPISYSKAIGLFQDLVSGAFCAGREK